jgi:hypothetical protein
MTARTALDEPSGTRSECWCCGRVEDPQNLVHLGNNPEVALCVGCARWAHRQGRAIEDRDKTGPIVRVKDELRSARRKVIQRGWHRNKYLGGALRWIGRYMP